MWIEFGTYRRQFVCVCAVHTAVSKEQLLPFCWLLPWRHAYGAHLLGAHALPIHPSIHSLFDATFSQRKDFLLIWITLSLLLFWALQDVSMYSCIFFLHMISFRVRMNHCKSNCGLYFDSLYFSAYFLRSSTPISHAQSFQFNHNQVRICTERVYNEGWIYNAYHILKKYFYIIPNGATTLI